MLFTEIILENYGPFLGKQSIRLSPVSEDKPIVLIGGMNGAGKTSILDAITLALFGKRADCSGRQNVSYGSFLKNSMHRDSSVSQSSITLSIERWKSGAKESIRLRREWSAKNGSATEKVQVHVNDKYSSFLSTSWDDAVESIIPFGISHLFFFNGEKIRDLADVNNSASIIRTATHALLGIDLIDQLIADLHALERRKSIEVIQSPDRAEIDKQRAAMEIVTQRIITIEKNICLQKNVIARAESKLHTVNNLFLAEGGDLYVKREQLEDEYKSIEEKHQNSQESLRKKATGTTPLALVMPLLQRTLEQSREESNAIQQGQFIKLISERDAELLRKASSNLSLSRKLIRQLTELLADDVNSRLTLSNTECYLGTTQSDYEKLQTLISHTLKNEFKDLEEHLDEHSFLEQRLTSVDRALSAVPEAERIASIIDERNQLTNRLLNAQKHLDSLCLEKETLERELLEKKKKLVASIRAVVNNDFENEDVQRVVHNSEASRKILDSFRKRIVRNSISKIEHLTLESAKVLFSKKDLFSKVHINPDNYTLSLFDNSSSEALCIEKFSEGERQLLAGSILWGLAKASSYPLPAIIDTPLGRLDSTHRRYLVESYFPNASHQVILLSTDEEITMKQFERLKAKISHLYYISHDKENKCSRIEAGYFPWMKV